MKNENIKVVGGYRYRRTCCLLNCCCCCCCCCRLVAFANTGSQPRILNLTAKCGERFDFGNRGVMACQVTMRTTLSTTTSCHRHARRTRVSQGGTFRGLEIGITVKVFGSQVSLSEAPQVGVLTGVFFLFLLRVE